MTPAKQPYLPSHGCARIIDDLSTCQQVNTEISLIDHKVTYSTLPASARRNPIGETTIPEDFPWDRHTHNVLPEDNVYLSNTKGAQWMMVSLVHRLRASSFSVTDGRGREATLLD